MLVLVTRLLLWVCEHPSLMCWQWGQRTGAQAEEASWRDKAARLKVQCCRYFCFSLKLHVYWSLPRISPGGSKIVVDPFTSVSQELEKMNRQKKSFGNCSGRKFWDVCVNVCLCVYMCVDLCVFALWCCVCTHVCTHVYMWCVCMHVCVGCVCVFSERITESRREWFSKEQGLCNPDIGLDAMGLKLQTGCRLVLSLWLGKFVMLGQWVTEEGTAGFIQ